MNYVNIYDAKTNFSELINQVAAGKEIIIAKNNKPIATLAPYIQKKNAKRKPGLWAHLPQLADQVLEGDAEIERLMLGDE